MRRLPVLAIAAALALTACPSSKPTPRVSPIPAVNATTAPGLPATANALPDVTFGRLRTLLASLHGTPVVLNVWGSWCGPCREEGPRLADAARRYGSRVQFLGLDVKDSLGAAQVFVRQMGWTYPSLFDPTPSGDVERQLGFLAQPVTVFYDRAGMKADFVAGPVSAASIAAGIGKILR